MKQRIMITLAGVIAVAIVAQQAVKRTFLKKETFMKLNRIAYFGAIFIPVLLLQANVRTEVPPDPGPPIYSFVQRLLDGSPYFIHDNQWAAVLFLRDPNCVPPTFNLLDLVDSTPAFPGGPPQPFLCALTASGFAIWNNGPPPIDFVPIQDHMQGLGQVPAWFVSRADMEAAVADDNLTVPELLAIPSLVKGYATQYLHDNQAWRHAASGRRQRQACSSRKRAAGERPAVPDRMARNGREEWRRRELHPARADRFPLDRDNGVSDVEIELLIRYCRPSRSPADSYRRASVWDRRAAGQCSPFILNVNNKCRLPTHVSVSPRWICNYYLEWPGRAFRWLDVPSPAVVP